MMTPKELEYQGQSECIFYKGITCKPLDTLKTHRMLNLDNSDFDYLDIYELLPAFCAICPKKEVITENIRKDFYGLKAVHYRLNKVSQYLDELEEKLSEAILNDFIEKMEKDQHDLSGDGKTEVSE